MESRFTIAALLHLQQGETFVRGSKYILIKQTKQDIPPIHIYICIYIHNPDISLVLIVVFVSFVVLESTERTTMSQLDLNAIVQQKLNGDKASRIEDAIAMSFYGDGVATITNAINRHTEAADESLARNNAIREKLSIWAAHTAYATRLDKQDDLRQEISKNVAASATNAMDLFAALLTKR